MNSEYQLVIDTWEGQLNNANRQIEHFQKLAKDAPIIETLREQLNAMNLISSEFQKAQDATLQLLKDKEKSFNELMKITNRDLSLPKVPKE